MNKGFIRRKDNVQVAVQLNIYSGVFSENRKLFWVSIVKIIFIPEGRRKYYFLGGEGHK